MYKSLVACNDSLFAAETQSKENIFPSANLNQLRQQIAVLVHQALHQKQPATIRYLDPLPTRPLQPEKKTEVPMCIPTVQVPPLVLSHPITMK